MKSNAAGSLLGYAMQLPRALLRLLQAGPGDAVSIEVHGDVGVLQKSGTILSEEDKSSLSQNPLTDRSVNLWKTLSNWIDAILSKELDIEKTWFVLFANKGGARSIAWNFSCALNVNESRIAIANAKKALANVDEKHEVWQYYDYVINQNNEILEKILPRFELEIGEGVGFDDIRHEIVRLHVPKQLVEELQFMIQGWLVETVLKLIVAKKKAIVTWEDFDKKFLHFFRNVRELELIDFASQRNPNEEEFHSIVKLRPLYLQQMEIIGSGSEEMIEAVTDFIKASINRTDWIEKEIIDKQTAKNFQENLHRYWKGRMTRYSITEKNRTPEERGILVLLDCTANRELIRGMSPPPSTVPGTYHFLADELELGWHPDWKKHFPK